MFILSINSSIYTFDNPFYKDGKVSGIAKVETVDRLFHASMLRTETYFFEYPISEKQFKRGYANFCYC